MTDKNFKKGDIIRIVDDEEMSVRTIDLIPKGKIWIVGDVFKHPSNEATMYDIFTLDRASNLYKDGAYPYAMELVEFPTSVEQELAWHIKSALDKSREKIKLEDMTLNQIRKLKEDLKKRIANVLDEFYDGTELHPTIKVTYDVTEIPLYMESYGGNITARSEECERIYERIIDINFNKKI